MNNYTNRFCCLLGFTTLFFATFLIGKPNDLDSASQNMVLKKFPIKASQGVAVDEKHFYAISNTKIMKCEKETGKQVEKWEANRKDEAFKHFMHMNSGTVIDGKLYCAHSRFPVEPNVCTVEIWNVEGEVLKHEETIQLPRKHGSLTWVDRDSDLCWWMCYAVYGKDKNKETKLVKYDFKDKKFIELESWVFPKEVVASWGRMSCSGGSWGPDGYLYTTGHDHMEAYVLEINEANKLSYVRTEKDVGFFGQAIAWDRFSKKPVLWGIIKNKNISLTFFPEMKVECSGK